MTSLLVLDFKLQYPASWHDYELIDSGDFEKLERFGSYILARPEPQALWKKAMDEKEWKQLAHAKFVREQKDKFRFADDAKGGWSKTRNMPDSWEVNYKYLDLNIRLRLALTSFGHVGIFPEQGANWNFIYDTIKSWSTPQPRVLNLFAYTGAASVVARAAGAQVIHCDASKPGLNWANQNMKLNNLSDIRWVYEDALKFVRREVKRGNRYNGIIMDPPPYGRGPEGEKWTLQEQLDPLVQLGARLLEEKNCFFVLSLYAAGLPAIVGYNVVKTYLNRGGIECGELFLKSSKDTNLPMGTFLRYKA